MTVTMSSEGESSKSVLSEANEKSGTDNNTDDSSQDSQDANEVKVVSKNSIEKNEEAKDAKSAEDTVADDKPTEKKDDPDDKDDNNTKSEDDIEKEVKDKSIEELGKTDKEKSEKNESEKKDKKPTKKEKETEKEKSDNSGQDDDDDDSVKEEDEEKEVPLLDQPLQKSGKRERKGVQRFEEPVESKEIAKIEGEGRGTSLGDIPRVDASISRFKNEDLKALHRVLFKVTGKSTMVKKNIRKFNGFDFEKDTDDYNKKIASIQKLEVKQLKSICEMLDLQKSGNKEEISERIVDFLLEPKDSGKPVDGGRPKRTAAVKANNRGYSSHDDYSSDEKQSSRARRDKGKRSNLKDDTSTDEEFKPNQSDGSDDRPRTNKRKRKNMKKRGSSEEDEDSEASVASSESDDEPKSKRKRSPVKANNKVKTAGKKTPGKRGRPAPATPAKKAGAKRGRKPKAVSSEDESEHKEDAGSSSEDEPLVKKTKNSTPPTDDEIKNFIKDILEGANLEEITMKNVCQRVYGNYPDFDLTHKKDFIKSTVKSLIST